MTDHQPNMRALKREWFWARVMGVLGIVLLIGVTVLVSVTLLNGVPPPPAVATAPDNPAEAAPPPPTAEARRQEDIALCDAALSTVQTLGLIPAFAVRDGDEAGATAVQGRYLCHAKTDAAKYSIVFDLACSHLGGANCIVPVTISQDGGGVLYQRH